MPSREVPSQICAVWGQNSHFLPTTALRPFKTAKRRKMVGTLDMQLDFLVSKTTSVPSNTTVCLRNTPQKAPKSARICTIWLQTAPTQEQRVSWATWFKTRFRGCLDHSQPGTFCGSQYSKSLKQTPRPLY